MVFRPKKQKQCAFEEVERGDCWIAISLAQARGLILAARVGKHTDNLLAALLHSTEGKTDGLKWSTDVKSSGGSIPPESFTTGEAMNGCCHLK